MYQNSEMPLALMIGLDIFEQAKLLELSPYETADDVLKMFEDALPAAGTTCATEAVLWAARSAIQIEDMPIKTRDRLLQFLTSLAVEIDSMHLKGETR